MVAALVAAPVHAADAPACGHAHDGGDAPHHGPETENLFGFTLGSDVEEAGTRAMALETVLRAGKGRGRYRALGQKLEFAYGITDDISLAVTLLAAAHRLEGVPSLNDRTARYRFDGVGGELRWRLLDRRKAPFGLTLHIEPELAQSDELSGERGHLVGAENKLIVDRELVRGQLFGALNLLFNLERFGTMGGKVERLSTAGLGVALAGRVADGLWLGSEARLLRAYEGLLLAHPVGAAAYVGPTVHAQLGERGWLSLAWQAHVGGTGDPAHAHEVDCAAPPAHADAFAAFERHQVRLKAGIEF